MENCLGGGYTKAGLLNGSFVRNSGLAPLAQFSRHYSLAEARGRIPWLRSIFAKIHLVLDISASGDGRPVGRSRSGNGNGGGPGGSGGDGFDMEAAAAGLTSEEKRELLKRLAQQILDQGVVIQDVRRGLVDFPAWKDSREVFLCYELDDGDNIGYWHEIDAGYAGRQEITHWSDA